MRFKHKHEEEEGINTNAWMMSYADMATTLLAMFIVLSTLGKDQTGISLYNGTGSFVHSMDSFGMPGLFPNSERVIQLEKPGPHYLGPGEGDRSGPRAGGTDKSGGNARVIDSEEEQLQQFLHELDRQYQVAKLPRIVGQATVDLYDRFNKKPPYLADRHAEVLGQVLPVLRRPNYRVEVIVWATTPSEGAWNRAADQALRVVEEIRASAPLTAEAKARIIPVGQPWRYPNVRRPILSLVIVKSE